MIPGERHMECAYYFDFCRLCLANASEKQRERGSCRAGELAGRGWPDPPLSH